MDFKSVESVPDAQSIKKIRWYLDWIYYAAHYIWFIYLDNYITADELFQLDVCR